jgi:K+ transporter
VLAGEPAEGSVFFRLCPAPLLPLPLVILATLATAVASQAVIAGTFSMTRQAIQLGWLPRFRIVQTSAAGYGQIYVPAVNWLLMTGTLALAIGFGSSDSLAAAYGIAVSATMLATTMLLSIAMREVWNWPLWTALTVGGVFGIVEGAFLSANLLKFTEGRMGAAVTWCIDLRRDANLADGNSGHAMAGRRNADSDRRHRGADHPRRRFPRARRLRDFSPSEEENPCAGSISLSSS